MIIDLTVKTLMKYLEKHYNYKITEDMSKEILRTIDADLDEYFSECELMDIVDEVMCKYEFC